MEGNEHEIGEVIADWLAASKAGDTEKVLALMAEDVVFLVPGQEPMRGKAAFAAGQGALSQFNFDATSEIQEIKVFGEWAYVWTNLTVVLALHNGGQSIKRSGHTLSIFNKQNGKWLLTRDANLLSVVQEE